MTIYHMLFGKQLEARRMHCLAILEAAMGKGIPHDSFLVDTQMPCSAGTPCAGSVSPWQKHLGSEEYEPNALLFSLARNATDLYSISDDQRPLQRPACAVAAQVQCRAAVSLDSLAALPQSRTKDAGSI